MPATVIEVADPLDRRLDDFRDLKDVGRRREGTFIAESELVIRRLVDSRFEIRSMLLTPQRYVRFSSVIAALSDTIDVFVGSEELLNALVGFPLHRGALALGLRTPDPSWQTITASARTIVIAEDIVDPDNVGAIFRHSAAFGVDAVVLSPQGGDPLYRKAVRSAMGWSLHIPWCRLTDHEWPRMLDDLRADGWQTLALTPSEDAETLPHLLEHFGPTERIALLLGSEHEGLTSHAIDHASAAAKIPMAPGVDSLNVATTAAIALYELARRSWSRS
jgi:tRNA G18 (ribose-2'-O)-methylase SpoU